MYIDHFCVDKVVFNFNLFQKLSRNPKFLPETSGQLFLLTSILTKKSFVIETKKKTLQHKFKIQGLIKTFLSFKFLYMKVRIHKNILLYLFIIILCLYSTHD